MPEKEANLGNPKIADSTENQYPAVPTAYDLAVKSYEFGERRFQAVENRNEKILGFTVTVNVALIVFLSSSNSSNLNLQSVFFIIAFLSGIVSLILGVLAMFTGRVGTVDITVIYERWLHLKENDFKTEFIIQAADDFKKTFKNIEGKSQLASLSAGFFLLEALLLIIWLLLNRPIQK
ncbi:MAG: hypothetical protein M3384_06260 [Acidobacteriota bacterium]|nr:hypothetical protein [Acidobacteriota bacterium]